MEDQRNWTDASYKTYVRPLALPWPYTLAKGTDARTIRDADRLRRGACPRRRRRPRSVCALAKLRARSPRSGSASIPTTRRPRSRMPRPCARSAPRISSAITIRAAATTARRSQGGRGREGARRDAVARGDRRRGRGVRGRDRGARRDRREPRFAVSRRAGLARARSQMHAAGQPLAALPARRWALSRGAPRLPGRAARRRHVQLFHRAQSQAPAARELDFVSFTTSAMVHAGDDRSVTEGLESLPHIARSVRAIIGDKPYAVGRARSACATILMARRRRPTPATSGRR